MTSARHIAVAVMTTAVMTVTALAACDTPATVQPSPSPSPVKVAWQEVTLPMPSGSPGRITLRHATVCSGQWFVVGAIVDPAGETRPAAWSSADGRTWDSYTFEAISFYGRQAVLYAAACRGDGTVAAVGSKRGGAHGNPRVTSWFNRTGRILTEVDASFELFGGGSALNVSRMAYGTPGYLIVGNRTSGAAVWNSPDASEFRIVEGVQPLASGADLDTYAADGIWDGARWTVVGATQRTGRIDRDPGAWTSPDGLSWSLQSVPADDKYDELQRVTRAGDSLVAVGVAGDTFRAWRRTPDGSWVAGGRFGDTTGMRSSFVASAAFSHGYIFVTVSDNTTFSVWSSHDFGENWAHVQTPETLPAGNDLGLSITSSEQQILLLREDAKHGRLWMANAVTAS